MDYWRFIQRRLHAESALHYPRNRVRKILRAYLNGTLNDCEVDSRHFFEQGFLLTCEGRFLDERGNEMGIPRKKGKTAEGTVHFELSKPATSRLKIPKGTLVYSSFTGYEYLTTYDAYIDVGETEVVVKIQAITYGKRFNAYEEELTTIDTTYLSKDLTVKNEIPILGGEDMESDAEYRQRLFNSISVNLSINFLKRQGIIIYSKKEYNNNIRIKLSSLNPYLNNKYAAIPPSNEVLNFLDRDVIHDKIMQIYIKGWK